jgi:tRNA uridine 5-carboxymethylaminomethyl modification enzyme
VLIDDLITRGAPEPYRMFTSRAEHRLLLREDNADLRLTEQGRTMGLVDGERWTFFCRKREAADAELARLHKARWRGTSAFDLLRRPQITLESLPAAASELAGPEAAAQFAADDPMMALAQLDERLPAAVALQVEVRAKYAGYIERQQDEIDRQRKHEELALPMDLDYGKVAGLSNEVRQRLATARPDTLGQASRLPGITPAAVSVLLVHLKRRSA